MILLFQVILLLILLLIFFIMGRMLVDNAALAERILAGAHHCGWVLVMCCGHWMATGVKGRVHVSWRWGVERSGWVVVMAMVVHVWMGQHHGWWVRVVWMWRSWVTCSASMHVG